MTLAPGSKLGPYEIKVLLGAGGMGEVYRARDTRLDRTVAIKILPAQFSSDPVRKQRFEREAKIISSLNHPHICVLYDIGHQDGIDYLVMECVEGETLAKRLTKGALPLEQVLKLGAQIADALDKAHRKGIVHRDIKPGNIMLTATGVKLLDFGLAKPVVPVANLAMLTATATELPVTEQGTIVGTFQYMSPEQVEGKEVDGRSDIFSLGTVLYEMLTGQRAFQGKSKPSVAFAILEKEPAPISSIKPLTPPALDRAIRRCLAKDPEERWQSGRDLHGEILWIGESGSAAALLHPSRREKKREQLAWVAAAVFAMIAAAALWAPWRVERPAPGPVWHLTMEVPPAEMLGPTQFFSRPTYLAIAISPDGKTVVFSGTHGPSTPQTQLYRRLLDQSDATVIPGTEGAAVPFFSPDGQWVGFFASGKLKKVPINGGPAALICDTQPGFWGASWASTDNIVFALTYSATLMQVPATGGKPQVLLKSNPAKQVEFYAARVFA